MFCTIIYAGEDDEESFKWCGHKFVGDNVDSKILPCHMRSDRQATDLHYFHQFAARDRVHLSGASEEPPSLNPDPVLGDLLPTESDIDEMLGILVSRILVQYMPFFKEHFSDVVVKHIPHEHQSEMEKISEVVKN